MSLVFGPHITNHLIREALHPYADDLVNVTKIGSKNRRKSHQSLIFLNRPFFWPTTVSVSPQ
jgi:hypothetical protein